MRQVLRAGALGRPRGMGWRGRREGGSGWGTHVNPWLIYVSVWQNPLQYCKVIKVISLQLIKINGKNKGFYANAKKNKSNKVLSTAKKRKKEKNESYQKIPATIQKNCHGGDDGAEREGDCHPKWPKLAQR